MLIFKKFLKLLESLGEFIYLLFVGLFFGKNIVKRRKDFLVRLEFSSIKVLFIVAIVAFFTGMILSLQSGLILKDFGQEDQVARLVTLTMWKEMGPFVVALILAASVGSAYAAQLATMTISEEVSALKVMLINPIDFLVSTRLYALIVATPLLILFGNLLGVIGGMLVAKTQLEVSPQAYWNMSLDVLAVKDVYIGLFKGVCYAILITIVSCFQGFKAARGTESVGEATRNSVIINFVCILIIGYMITAIFYS